MERGKITFFCQRGRVHFNLRYVNKYMHEHELNRVKSFVQHGTTQTLASSLLSPNTLWVFKKWPNRIRNSVVTVNYDWLKWPGWLHDCYSDIVDSTSSYRRMLSILAMFRRVPSAGQHDLRLALCATFASQSFMAEMKVFDRATKLKQRNRAALQSGYDDYEFIR